MKGSMYYYGIDAKSFKDLKYTDALKVKIKAGRELLNKLSTELYLKRATDKEKWSETAKRLNDVVKAIKFNEKLLKECE